MWSSSIIIYRHLCLFSLLNVMGQHDAELSGGVVLKAVLLLVLQLMELYSSLPSFHELFAAAAANAQWFV